MKMKGRVLEKGESPRLVGKGAGGGLAGGDGGGVASLDWGRGNWGMLGWTPAGVRERSPAWGVWKLEVALP